jgi:hypothetical protein
MIAAFLKPQGSPPVPSSWEPPDATAGKPVTITAVGGGSPPNERNFLIEENDVRLPRKLDLGDYSIIKATRKVLEENRGFLAAWNSLGTSGGFLEDARPPQGEASIGDPDDLEPVIHPSCPRNDPPGQERSAPWRPVRCVLDRSRFAADVLAQRRAPDVSLPHGSRSW